jgi:hypothetical protein
MEEEAKKRKEKIKESKGEYKSVFAERIFQDK